MSDAPTAEVSGLEVWNEHGNAAASAPVGVAAASSISDIADLAARSRPGAAFGPLDTFPYG